MPKYYKGLTLYNIQEVYMAKFLTIRHPETKTFAGKESRTYLRFLGEMQIDVPNTARFYSKATNETVEYTVSPNLTISKKIIKNKERISCPDSLAIMEANE